MLTIRHAACIYILGLQKPDIATALAITNCHFSISLAEEKVQLLLSEAGTGREKKWSPTPWNNLKQHGGRDTLAVFVGSIGSDPPLSQPNF